MSDELKTMKRDKRRTVWWDLTGEEEIRNNISSLPLVLFEAIHNHVRPINLFLSVTCWPAKRPLLWHLRPGCLRAAAPEKKKGERCREIKDGAAAFVRLINHRIGPTFPWPFDGGLVSLGLRRLMTCQTDSAVTGLIAARARVRSKLHLKWRETTFLLCSASKCNTLLLQPG